MSKANGLIEGGTPSSSTLLALNEVLGNLCQIQQGSFSKDALAATIDKLRAAIQEFEIHNAYLITDRKVADNAALEGEKFARLIMNSVAEGIYGIDMNGCCTFCNQACLDLLGYSTEDELLGKNMHSLIHFAHADGSPYPVEECAIFVAFQKGTKSHIDSEALWKKDGSSFASEYWSYPQIRDGKVVGAVVSFIDITERKKSEATLLKAQAQLFQNSKLATLGEMAAGIAHEINTPLSIISGSVGLLSKVSGDPEKFASKVESIRKASRRIAKIIMSLKKFSGNSEAGNYGNHLLSNIIKVAMVITKSKAKRHDTLVTFNCISEKPIHCDEIEIEQVIINLINNSIEAVVDQPERWVKIELSETSDSIVVWVYDSGKGIPEKIQERLFDPFFTTKGVGGGTGLGLSIIKGILDEHQATISVLANVQNTCFEIRFKKIAEPKKA